MSEMTVIDHLFAGIVAGDLGAVRACFTPDAKVWHGYDCIAHDLEGFLGGLEKAFAAGMALRYDDIRRLRTEDGFVQHHVFVAPAPGGGWDCKPCCNVFHLKDGRIHRVEEYLDRTGTFHVDSLPAVTPGI